MRESGSFLAIESAVAAALVEDAVRSAPPLRADPSVAVNFCGVSGKGSTKLGRNKTVDDWYDELEEKNVDAPWRNVPRQVYEAKRVVLNFFGCLCYAQLMSDRPEGREICTTILWNTLDRRGVQKKWGLPSAQTMRTSLARYPAVDVVHLSQTIGMAAAVFTCELEGDSDQGSHGDRLLIANMAIGTLIEVVTGNLGAFGREITPATAS